LDGFSKKLNQESHVSSSFFYNFQARYQPLFAKKEGEENIFDNKDFLSSILKAELASSNVNEDEIEKISKDLLAFGRPLSVENDQPTESPFYFDSGMIARFLATEGRWKLGNNGENQ
jgi:hypothetical protein